MTPLIRIWTCPAHHAAFRCGGWAAVRAIPGRVTGMAGGERNTAGRRMALAALAAALGDLSPAAPRSAELVRLETPSLELASLARGLADLAGDDDADRDLWGRIFAASTGRRFEVVHVPLESDACAAFVAAWAEQAMNQAKARGAFAAAIPRTNLGRVEAFVAAWAEQAMNQAKARGAFAAAIPRTNLGRVEAFAAM